MCASSIVAVVLIQFLYAPVHLLSVSLKRASLNVL